MRNSIFQVLISTLKAKITPLVTKFRYWTSAAFWRAKVFAKLREFIEKVLKIKPRDKHDYYSIGWWLVSKRLAHALVIVVGVLCLCYLIFVNPVYDMAKGIGNGEKIYSYNSLPLRFMKGNVKIKAKSGYIAYEGAVDDGYATGYGELYDKDRRIIYRGNFEKNKYQGVGALYYESGQVKYNGDFVNNIFQGSGNLYRENGTMEFSGEFEGGKKEGTGTLYDAAQTPVFTGSFHSDELVYSQMLGKTAKDISEIYTGDTLIYMGDEHAVIVMPEIDAFYLADTAEDSVDDSVTADCLYVCKDSFTFGDVRCGTISEIKELLGEPVFEGNSYVVFPEAVGIDWMQQNGADIDLDVAIRASQPLKEVYQVDSFSADELLYLYLFQKDDTTYTFICTERGEDFFMYQMQM